VKGSLITRKPAEWQVSNSDNLFRMLQSVSRTFKRNAETLVLYVRIASVWSTVLLGLFRIKFLTQSQRN